MSDTDRDVADHGREAVRTARTSVLRNRLRRFVDEHEPPEDLETMRRQISGDAMSTAIVEDRADRV